MRRGLVPSRSAAQQAISDHRVEVDGIPAPRPATLVAPSSDLRIVGDDPTWASRAGHKLAAALEAFSLEVAGRRALDVGASTGGFTDVLLDREAKSVTALDVGYGQLVWRLQSDPRVTVVDRTNFRHVDPADLGAPFEVITVDVSFISVTLLGGQLAACGAKGSDYVILVKPQFEAGKAQVGRGGVVSDPSIHAAAIRAVGRSLAASGIGSIGLCRSPIRGAKGNQEYLLHGRLGVGAEPNDTAIEEVTRP